MLSIEAPVPIVSENIQQSPEVEQKSAVATPELPVPAGQVQERSAPESTALPIQAVAAAAEPTVAPVVPVADSSSEKKLDEQDNSSSSSSEESKESQEEEKKSA